MAPDIYVHAVLKRAILIELCLFQHLKHMSVKWDANEFSIQYCATLVWDWCDFLLHHSICATIPTEGNDNITWMPMVDGLLFFQAVLQVWQTFLHFQTHGLDKKWSYYPSFGNTIKLQVYIALLKFSLLPLWPGQKQWLCSSISSFQSKYILASQQGLFT